jgi:ribosomal protein S9
MSITKENYYSLDRLQVIVTWGYAEDMTLVDTAVGTDIGMTVSQAKKLRVDISRAISTVTGIEDTLRTDLQYLEAGDTIEYFI